MSSLNVKGGVMCENINIVDSSTYSGQYQVSISPPTGTTNSKIQTIQQGTGFNQVLELQPAGGTILLSGQTTAKLELKNIRKTTVNLKLLNMLKK